MNKNSRTYALKNTAAIGNMIKQERKRQGLTQSELADVSGVGLTYISHIENGKETAEVGKLLNVITMLGIDVTAATRG